MAAAFDNSSRSWWSMAKAHNDGAPEYHSEKPKPKSKSLHSLFGRKSKKHCPTLAIEDPPLPIQPVPSEYAQSFNNRPLSKSVSSTRSRNDSLEPRTPSDFHHNHNIARHSLLTLSDTDPFASGRSVGIASPQLPSDPTRLSAYSNTSSTEQHQRKNVESVPFQRASYASSSYSQNHAPESPVPLSPVPPIANGFHGKLLTKRSDTALNGNRARQPSSSISSGTASGISSNMPSRPPTRPRGLTDIGAAQKSGFFVDKQSSASSLTTSSAKSSDSRPPPTRPPSSRRPSNASSGSRVPPVSSPRVVIRQASIQGLSQPAPPPTQRLPAPPAHSHAGNDILEMSSSKLRRERSNSTLGSKISFASVLSTEVLPSPPPVATHIRPRRVSDRSVFKPGVSDIDKTNTVDRKPSFSPLTPPMTLKKALSHQSLIKRGSPFLHSLIVHHPHLTTARPGSE
ncbi:hypothetical protein DFP72DRAFT_26524 [Ephemerocybe angulata]|uniref:Uncharacterized protein n=1 Tax=Ephemerocybe angulata TaxID=980116 RepID=A0A8H6MHJ6_9AGAR|nr:hypothetical protein DFP72DRAFT_26524 [Tulosesus angulatus]